MNPSNRIVLVCRTEEKAMLAKADILPLLPQTNREKYAPNIIPIACDHTSLDSVRRFNTVLRKRLKDTYCPSKWLHSGIDVLCLNAAVLTARDSEAQFTRDGLETTFQTNYLAPFLIANLTLDLLNPGARVVLATSGLHCRAKLDLKGVIDPRTGQARKGFETLDGSPFHYKESYAVSKLCIVFLCAALNRRLHKRGITVNCFSPGLMTDSGLFRHQHGGGDPSDNVNQEVLAKVKPVAWGAGAIVFMATATETGMRSGEYWSDPDTTLGWQSVYGRDFHAASIAETVDWPNVELLWKVSCELVGICPTDSSDESVQSED